MKIHPAAANNHSGKSSRRSMHAPVIVGFFFFLSEAFFSAVDLDLVEAAVDNDADADALDFLGVLP